MTMACAFCDFSTDLPAEMMAHMTNTGHGVPAHALEELRRGGDLYSVLAENLELVASKATPEEVRAISNHVDADDPDLPEGVRDFIETARARNQKRQEAEGLPPIDRIAGVIFARALSAIFCAGGNAIAETAADRMEFLARFRVALALVIEILNPAADNSPANAEAFGRKLAEAFDRHFPDSPMHMAESFDQALAEVREEIRQRQPRTARPS